VNSFEHRRTNYDAKHAPAAPVQRSVMLRHCDKAFGTEPGAIATGSSHSLRGSNDASRGIFCAWMLARRNKVECLTRSLPLPLFYRKQYNVGVEAAA